VPRAPVAPAPPTVSAVSDVRPESVPSAAPGKPPRDARLDFFRGLALWFIYVDHVPSTGLANLTFRNFGFSDATEIFVFISGYTAALVYGASYARRGGLHTAAQVLRRCWQLYAAHVMLFVFYVAQVAWVADRFAASPFVEEMNIARFFDDPQASIFEALSLQYRPVNLDVLPLYVALLASLPAWLALARHSPIACFAVSLAIWAGVQAFGWTAPVYANGDTWMFNPLGWQLLFVLGVLCALDRGRDARVRRRRPWLAALAIAWLAFSAGVAISWKVPALEAAVTPWVGDWLYPIDKTDLDAARILHFLAIAWLVARAVGPGSGAAAFALRPARDPLRTPLAAGVLPRDLAVLRGARDAGAVRSRGVAGGAGHRQRHRRDGRGRGDDGLVWPAGRRARRRGGGGVTPARAVRLGAATLALGCATAGDAVASPDAPVRDARCEVPASLSARPRLPGLSKALGPGMPPATVVVLDPLGVGARRPDLGVVRWPVRLQAELGARLSRRDLRVAIVGREPSDVGRLALLLERTVLPSRPALVVWPIGRADIRQGIPPNRFGERLRGGLDALRRHGIDAIVLDIAYHPQSEAIARSDEHRHHLRWVAEDAGAWLFPRFEMIEHWADEGRLDLDSGDPATQLESAERIQACIAMQLARAIAAGVAGSDR
jgi:hypothetical protein